MTASLDLQELIAAADAAIGEVLPKLLGGEAPNLAAASALPEGDRVAAFVAVVGAGTCVQLGLALPEADAAQAARTMWALAEDDPDPGPEEIADALGELANIIAGATKRKLAAGESFDLGIPLLLRGRILVTGRQFLSVRRAEAAGIRFDFVLLVGDPSLVYAKDGGEQITAG